ncbi:MAG: diguanylate cyclase [Ardenticatenales bacterium]|nr:diguanylate cyclase [Ardenticatenales bacterium]
MALLLVDDSLDIRLLLQVFLNDEGYTDLLMASSAREAFAILGVDTEKEATHGVELILMDIAMPEMDGIEACRHIKTVEHLRDIPLIMVTAKTEAEHLKEAFNAGAIDYITKPVNEIELLARVNSALTLKREMDRRKAREQQLLAVKRQLEVANEELLRLSSLDGLTGISNRRRFNEFLEREWRRAMRGPRPVSLILIDIDYFKPYNDALGHQAGDECLKQIAEVLELAAQRPSDLAARYGGEEFVVVLGNTAREGALRVAEAIRQRVALLSIAHPSSTISPCITLSMGIATGMPCAELSPSILIAAADHALYQAKQQGRDCMKVAQLGQKAGPFK